MIEPKTTHAELMAIAKRLPSDFEPYGGRSREDDWSADCSCGCRFFVPLGGKLAYDWGVCANAASPRAGLLTFEHMGCREFDQGQGDDLASLCGDLPELEVFHQVQDDEGADAAGGDEPPS